MPTNLLATDTMYPDLSKGTTDEKIQQIGNYLYMLREQLRYTLGNLGESNFNDSELENIGNIITEPIYLQIYGTEGNAVIQFTEKGLYGRIEDAENNVAQVSATSQALMSRMTNAEGNISTLTQTANSLSSRITSLDGSVSSLSQTVNGFKLSVSNGSTSSTIKLMSGSTEISSQTIKITGMVTFSSLSDEDETTVINGCEIETGTLTAVDIYGSTIYAQDDEDSYMELEGDGLKLWYDGTAKMQLGWDLFGYGDDEITIILGTDTPGYISKFYKSRTNYLWIGDYNENTGLMIDLTNGTWELRGDEA